MRLQSSEKKDVECAENNPPDVFVFRNISSFYSKKKKRSFHPKQENKIKQTYNINNNNNNQSLRG